MKSIVAFLTLAFSLAALAVPTQRQINAHAQQQLLGNLGLLSYEEFSTGVSNPLVSVWENFTHANASTRTDCRYDQSTTVFNCIYMTFSPDNNGETNFLMVKFQVRSRNGLPTVIHDLMVEIDIAG